MSTRKPLPATALPLGIIACLLVAAIIVPRLLRGAAAMPEAYQSVPTLDAALEQSASTGRPVLALVTSDTCPACDRLKRSTLTDNRVTQLVGDRFVPVVVNEGANPEDARRLPYMYLPTTLLIREGTVVARLEGYRPPGEYLAWLEQAGTVTPPSAPGQSAAAP